jgi:hypothetical protein
MSSTVSQEFLRRTPIQKRYRKLDKKLFKNVVWLDPGGSYGILYKTRNKRELLSTISKRVL